jgi:tetratricopeptide (TPR) repeat protein
MVYYFHKSCCIALIILSLSPLKAGLTLTVQAQTTQPPTTKTKPQSSVNHLNRGRERFQQKNYKGALEDFNSAILLNPKEANAYYYRGLILRTLGDTLGAVLDFDRALELNPRNASAYFHRAGARYAIGEETGTILDLQLAAKLFQSQGDTKGYQKAQNLMRQLQRPTK